MYLQCPPKVLEQNKIFSDNFKKCVNLKCPLQTIWIENQAQRNVGPGLQSILFDIQHHVSLKTGCIAWDFSNYVDIEIWSILQIVSVLLEGSVS